MKRRIVLTGLGVVTSLGRPVETLWSRLLAGDSGVGPISMGLAFLSALFSKLMPQTQAKPAI